MELKELVTGTKKVDRYRVEERLETVADLLRASRVEKRVPEEAERPTRLCHEPACDLFAQGKFVCFQQRFLHGSVHH